MHSSTAATTLATSFEDLLISYVLNAQNTNALIRHIPLSRSLQLDTCLMMWIGQTCFITLPATAETCALCHSVE